MTAVVPFLPRNIKLHRPCMCVSHKISVLINKIIFSCISPKLVRFSFKPITNPGPSQCVPLLGIFFVFQYDRYGENSGF